jgi:hypothetical protein
MIELVPNNFFKMSYLLLGYTAESVVCLENSFVGLPPPKMGQSVRVLRVIPSRHAGVYLTVTDRKSQASERWSLIVKLTTISITIFRQNTQPDS